MSPRHRVVVPEQPLHIIQRGLNRWPTFLEEVDLAFYRFSLAEASAQEGCAVHAWVLMTNHVHLLVTPAHADSPGRMMQSLGRRYVRYFNDRYRRSGTLWEGRYRSVAIKSDAHFLACSRYIELNPVRAAMVDAPGAYVWSSFRCNATGEKDEIIRSHALYEALGADPAERRASYRALFAHPLTPEVVAAIRGSTRGRFEFRSTTYEQVVNTLNEQILDARAGSAAGKSEVDIPWPELPVAGFAGPR